MKIKFKFLMLAMAIGFSTIAWAQTNVSGTVVDELNEPLPGASVLVKGTSNGVVTDFDGNFNITVQDGGTILVISYIGYKNKELILDGSASYTILFIKFISKLLYL